MQIKHLKIRNSAGKAAKPTNKKFWQFRNSADGGIELLLYGDISDSSWWGDEVTPKQFADELAAAGAAEEITVRINSGGGDVFAAQAIGNMLEQHHANIIAKIDGLCASAATIVACHCNKVIAANDSTYMVHPVRMGIVGYVGAEELQNYLQALETIRDNIITLYAKKTCREKDEVAAWMDATNWWTGQQAKDNGFVDELVDDGEETIVENRDGVLFVNKTNMNMPFNEAPKFVQDSLAAEPAAEPLVNTTPENPENKKSQKEVNGMEIKTLDDLRAAYPELVNQAEQAAAQAATDAERQRIKDIEDMALTGSEEAVNDAKFVNPVSAQDFAIAAMKNQKAQGANYLDNVTKDATESGANNVQQQVGNEGADEFMDAIKALNPNN